MGEISKQRQLNEKEQYRTVRDLSFNEVKGILKFAFKHHLINEVEIFKILHRGARTMLDQYFSYLLF
jgi:hypothetical protein